MGHGLMFTALWPMIQLFCFITAGAAYLVRLARTTFLIAQK